MSVNSDSNARPIGPDVELFTALGEMLAKLLRPLVRLLLRHSIPYSAFAAIARREYVESAMEDFRVPGRKPSVSRAAVITGLTRKEVAQVQDDQSSAGELIAKHENRASRVLTAWAKDARFMANGARAPLPMDGPRGFAELVRVYGGDVPVMAVLDELRATNRIHLQSDGKFAFVPPEKVNHDKLQLIEQLGIDAGALIDALSRGLDDVESGARLIVVRRAVPLDALPRLRAAMATRAEKLFHELETESLRLASARDDDAGATLHPSAVIGVFGVEHPSHH